MESYKTGNLLFRKALPEDDSSLRALMRENDMASWVRISFEREPSYFDGENLMGDSDTVIAFDDKTTRKVIGMYSCHFLPVHVNGRPESVGYIGSLRVAGDYRNKIRILKSGFKSIEKLTDKKSTLPFWFTSLASENQVARRVLEAGLKDMPIYKPVSELKTLAFSNQQGRSSDLLQPATQGDIPGLVDFYNQQNKAYQFSPVLTEEWLLNLSEKKGLSLNDFYLLKNNGDIQACIALWDQRAFKQTVARGYRFPLNFFRNVYNLYASFSKRLSLPAVGNQLDQVYLAFAGFDKSISTVMVDVIRESLTKLKRKQASVGVLGLSTVNPLLDTLTKQIPAQVYNTCLETVSWPTVDMPDLDGRPVQPEVALL